MKLIKIICILLFISCFNINSYCAYAEIIIKEYGNGKFQVWNEDKVLQSSGFTVGEWLESFHSYKEYTYFDSLSDAKEVIEESKKSKTVVKTIDYQDINNYCETNIEVGVYSDNIVVDDTTIWENKDKIYSKLDNQLYFCNDLGEEILISSPVWIETSLNQTDQKKEKKMEFIFKVFGSNVIIFIGSLLYIVCAFFTIKNVFYDIYNAIKEDGMKYEGCVKFFIIVLGCIFPVVWTFILSYFVIIFLKDYVLKNIFVFLDKVVPRVEIKKEK